MFRAAKAGWACIYRASGTAFIAARFSLFTLTFADPAEMRADVAGKPVYLGLAINAEGVVRIKPQNLLLNLPLASAS